MQCKNKIFVSLLITIIALLMYSMFSGVLAATCSHSNATKATCTQGSFCQSCYKQISKPIGHKMAAATCTKPATCLRAGCGATEGNALGHYYANSTCTKPATCVRCSKTTGAALGHNFKKEYQETSQSEHMTISSCTRCKYTTEILESHKFNSNNVCTLCDAEKACDHTYANSTCTKPATCTKCGKTTGAALGHSVSDWSNVTASKHTDYCTRCGATVSEPHEFKNDTCEICGYTKECNHTYSNATCTKPATCSKCGQTKGSKLGHSVSDWSNVTASKHTDYCTRCGATVSESHKFKNDTCEICGYTKECNHAGALEYGNGPNHTIDCKKCGYYNVVDHTFINGICSCGATEYAKCSNAGPLEEHSASVKYVYIKSFIEEHKYKFECDLCGFKSKASFYQKHTFTNGKCVCGYEEYCTYDKILEGHNVILEYNFYDKFRHTYSFTCVDCGDFTHQEGREVHSGPNYKSKGECEICGAKTCKKNNLISTHDIEIRTEENVNSKGDIVSHTVYQQCKTCDISYDDTHKLSTSYKFDTAQNHIKMVGCKECNAVNETQEEHSGPQWATKGKCKYCKFSMCTENKAVNGHNIIKTGKIEPIYDKNGVMNKSKHCIVTYCNDCKVELRVEKENHKIEGNKGTCTCGYIDINKAKCTEDEFVEGHKITYSYQYNSTKDHYVISTCKKCNVTSSVQKIESHGGILWASKGKCVCKYQVCTERLRVKGHTSVDTGILTIMYNNNGTPDKNKHYVWKYCSICDKTIKVQEAHTVVDNMGRCSCGYSEPQKAICTKEGYALGHEIKKTYEQYSINGHRIVETCKKCKFSQETHLEEHSGKEWLTKGKCELCNYKRCISSNGVSGHNINETGKFIPLYNKNGEIDSDRHYIEEYCVDCNVIIYEKKDFHEFNCTCFNIKNTDNKCVEGEYGNSSHIITKKYKPDTEDRLQYHIISSYCEECNVSLKDEYSEHSGPQWASRGICEYCKIEKCTSSKETKGHNIISTTKMVQSSEVSGMNNPNYHYLVKHCNDCGIDIMVKEDHIFINEKGECICGYVNILRAVCTDKALVEGHNKQTFWRNTGTGHVLVTKCMSGCGAEHIGAEEEHSFKNGKCTVCNFEFSCTDNFFREDHKTETYWEFMEIGNKKGHVQYIKCASGCNAEQVSKAFEEHKYENGKCIVCGYKVK